MSNGNTKKGFDKLAVAKEAKIDELDTIIQYLIEEELIRGNTGGDSLVGSLAYPLIFITHKGVKEVEQALTNPQSSTQHFPPNIIYIAGNVTESAIQQGSSYAKQIVNINRSQHQDLNEILELLKGVLNESGLKQQNKTELNAEVQTIVAQVHSPKPKIMIIRESLSSAKAILEGVSTVITTVIPIIHKINTWLSSTN
jgi:mRNA-degrading endonuclease YafQ of YafQ-DinJ toxin-antitoxin module